MAVDPSIIGNKGEPGERSWTSTDSLLYSIGVGAGLDHPYDELEFTAENAEGVTQKALPSLIGVLGAGKGADMGELNWHMLLHAEQAFTLHKPLPVEGRLSAVSEVKEVWDKGSGALIITETEYTDLADNTPLATIRGGIFIRGDGGFGGPKQPTVEWELPTGKPDHEVVYITRPEQALLYRLTGDRNPLHVDPKFAAKGGFDRPILHGMCTYGFTARALLHTAAGGDPDKFHSMSGRFTKSVWPGDTLTVSVWVDGDTARFQTRTQDGTVVIDRGVVTTR
jgi:acyl dehydratase